MSAGARSRCCSSILCAMPAATSASCRASRTPIHCTDSSRAARSSLFAKSFSCNQPSAPFPRASLEPASCRIRSRETSAEACESAFNFSTGARCQMLSLGQSSIQYTRKDWIASSQLVCSKAVIAARSSGSAPSSALRSLRRSATCRRGRSGNRGIPVVSSARSGAVDSITALSAASTANAVSSGATA